ncbi:hypothetical protein [Streptomyces xinghaiensis]|uniref:hypothetical protein n=1 Tax=Streptomyces xinghaiensis TaxID=1038928 RepID=UPI00342A6929
MRLMLQRSLSVDETVLERIMQAALFYADAVTVRASATVPGDSPAVYRRLGELMDIGAVTTWAHEYELGGNDRLRPGHRRTVASGEPDHVVPVETTRRIGREIDDELAESRDPAYGTEPGLREGVSEVVQLRHSMSTFRLADVLDSEGVLAGGRERSPIVRTAERSTRPEDPREDIVREVVGHCSFGRLAHLPLRAVEDCRQAMPRFRDLLARQIAAGSGEGRSVSPAELAALILAEYRKVRGPALPARAPAAEGATWDVVGAVLPHSVVVRAMGRRIEWFKYRGRARPFMLLGRLQQYSPSP